MISGRKVTIIYLIISLLFATSGYAQQSWVKWSPEDGVPVRQSLHTEWKPTGIRRNDGDMAGEIGFVWTNARSGKRGIVLQVIDPEGEFKYPEEGLQVLELNTRFEVPIIGASSDGGWYLFWTDYRNNGDDLYGTKVTADGEVVWGADEGGSLIIEGEREYLCEKVIDDGEGGCFILIKRTINNLIDRFVHHVTADGSPDPDWPEEGMSIRWDDAVSDGNGSMICSRTDDNRDVMLQKISRTGELLWGDGEGILACIDDAQQHWSKLCADGVGGCIVVWVDSRNGEETDNDIYAQRVNSEGELLWGEAGAALCVTENDQRKLNIINIGEGQAVVVWNKLTEDNDDLGIYAMRISGENELTLDWEAESGVAVVTSDLERQRFLINPSLCPDGSGGVYIVWQDRRDDEENYTDVYAQRINAEGETVWEENGIPLQRGEFFQGFPIANQIADSRCCVVWNDESDLIEKVKLQYVDLDGEFEWDDGGLEFVTGFDDGIVEQIVVGIGEGNFAAAWIEQTYGIYGARPHVQFGHDAGDSVVFEFGENGIPAVEGDVTDSENLSGIPDGEGGVILVWQDGANSAPGWNDIWAQRISSDGELLWNREGMMISDFPFDQENPIICSDENGGVIITWMSIDDIYVQRISAEGERLWGEVGERITASESEEDDIQIASDNEGGAVIVWRFRTEDREMQVRTQRLNNEGNWLWGDEPIILTSSSESQREPQVVRHPEGFFIVWEDRQDQDIYGQFIEADGELRWDENGSLICGSIEFQHFPKTVVDSEGLIWVLWDRTRDIIMQKIDPGGEEPDLIFEEDGRSVVDYEGTQTKFNMKTDHHGGLWVVWNDARPQVEGLYATHFNPNGEPYEPFVEDGNRVGENLHSYGIPQTSVLTEGGESGIVVTCLDGRGSGRTHYYDIYCQRVADDAFAGVIGENDRYVLPTDLSIIRVHPNPFNSTTTITFSLPLASQVALQLYDITGREVATLFEDRKQPGAHTSTLSATDLPSGQYFIRLKASDQVITQKVMLIR